MCSAKQSREDDARSGIIDKATNGLMHGQCSIVAILTRVVFFFFFKTYYFIRLSSIRLRPRAPWDRVATFVDTLFYGNNFVSQFARSWRDTR